MGRTCKLALNCSSEDLDRVMAELRLGTPVIEIAAWLRQRGYATACARDVRMYGDSRGRAGGRSDYRYLEALERFQAFCESIGEPYRTASIEAWDDWIKKRRRRDGAKAASAG